MSNTNHSFSEINDTLLNLGAVHSAAELHGDACASLCVSGKNLSAEEWYDAVKVSLDLPDPDSLIPYKTLFISLFDATQKLLSEKSLSFSPLLPGEGASLERRTMEMSLWCRSFLQGLGNAGLDGDTHLNAESAEALRDLAQIAQADVGEELSDTAESEWESLRQYINIAVLNIYSSIQDAHSQGSESDAPNKTDHSDNTIH